MKNLSTAGDFNFNNSNYTINTTPNETLTFEENNTKCDLFGSFGFYVQLVLAGLSFMILICNLKYFFLNNID